MFTNEQMKEVQGKLHEAFQSTQKLFETLGDRAQAELKLRMVQAQASSKDQIAQLGKELVRLGQKLQELARHPGLAKEQAAGSGVQPPPPSAN